MGDPGWSVAPDAAGEGPAPRRYGPWELGEELGRGGAGLVYRVRGPTGESRALKVLLAPTETLRRRFAREVAVLRRLEHPNLVRILDAGQEGTREWLVMELIEGGSLAGRLAREGPLEPREAARIVRDLALALAHAHQQGVLHRDVKPSNVLLDAQGTPRLTDFGLARDLHSEEERLSLSGQLLGTPGYWAPEQAAGRRERIGPATDVFGLGATLYAALTGRPPWEASSLAEHLVLVEREAPVPPSRHRSGLDPALERICLRCLAPDPAARFPSAASLAEALEAHLRAPLRSRARLGLIVALLVIASAGAVVLLAFRAPPDPARPAEPAAAPLQELRLEPGPLLGKDTTVTDWPLADDDNYGAAPTLGVGHRVRNGRAHAYESLIAFDLAALPRGITLERAVLSLSGAHRWPLVIGVQALDGREWIEGTSLVDGVVDGVTWRDRPGVAAWSPELELPVSPDELSPGFRRHELDVTAVVRACLTRGLAACELRLRALGSLPGEGSWTSVFFASDAAGERPRLTLTWRGSPPGPLPDEAALEREAESRALALLYELPGSPRERLVVASRALALAPHSQQVLLARSRAAWALRRAEGLQAGAGDTGTMAREDVLRALALGPEAQATALDLLSGHLAHEPAGPTIGLLSELLRAFERGPRPAEPPAEVLAALETLPLEEDGALIELHAAAVRCWGGEAAAASRGRLREALLATEPDDGAERAALIALLTAWSRHWPNEEVERRRRELESR